MRKEETRGSVHVPIIFVLLVLIWLYSSLGSLDFALCLLRFSVLRIRLWYLHYLFNGLAVDDALFECVEECGGGHCRLVGSLRPLCHRDRPSQRVSSSLAFATASPNAP